MLRLLVKSPLRSVLISSLGKNVSPLLLSKTCARFVVTSQPVLKKEEVEVTFHLANGQKIKAKGKEGDSLLDIVVNNNVPLDGFGACEGTLTCSTCHLIFQKEDYDKLPDKPTDEELDMLDLAYELTDTSRLGCQIIMTKELSGLEIKVPAGVNDCSWPEFSLGPEHPKNVTKALLLADVHLLGPYRGHWFDKLRREWQMHRSFQTAITLFQPEVVFILGDLFDEGQWCDKLQFLEYYKRFLSLFSLPSDIRMFVVPGNHDVGFHYAIRPVILHKFEDLFSTSSVQFLNLKESYFILINSMAMEGDGCDFCSDAEKHLKKISAELQCAKDNKKCAGVHIKNYSRPIILQHFPMYRKSDSGCNEQDEAPPEIKNTAFREKWDCLSQKASEMIYNELNPRAIFTGHVHHGCHVVHKKDIHEYTLPSFSWRNKNNPTFMLAKFTPNDYILEKCHLPRESTVIILYCSVILGVVAYVAYLMRNRFFKMHKVRSKIAE